MDFQVPDELSQIRAAVRELYDRFPGEYWRSLEPDRHPEEFVTALTEHGWLAALIPEDGGAGLGLAAASVILEVINASGGNAGACQAQMYTMGTILRHGSEEQKARYFPRIASGELDCRRSVSPSRPPAPTRRGSKRRPSASTAVMSSAARRSGPRGLYSDLMLLLARTTPLEQVERRTEGLVNLHRRHEGGGRGGDDNDPPDPDADEPRDYGDLLCSRFGR